MPRRVVLGKVDSQPLLLSLRSASRRGDEKARVSGLAYGSFIKSSEFPHRRFCDFLVVRYVNKLQRKR